MSIAAHHAEWLTLVPHSGPFLSVGVLTEAFPDGLSTVDSKRVAELRAAYGTWSDPEGSDYADIVSRRSSTRRSFCSSSGTCWGWTTRCSSVTPTCSIGTPSRWRSVAFGSGRRAW